MYLREEGSSIKFFEHYTYSYFKSLFLCYRYLREERSSLENRQILTLNVTVLFHRNLREERSSLKNCIETKLNEASVHKGGTFLS